MELPSREFLLSAFKSSRLSKRLVRDIRYIPEAVTHPELRDFFVATTKSGNEGVLLFEGKMASFELQRRGPNKAGRVEAIICDICATWQRGTASGVITFKKNDRSSVSYLVCADLDCSLHVRDRTPASKVSRTQLREHISPENRVVRLNDRLRNIMSEVAV